MSYIPLVRLLLLLLPLSLRVHLWGSYHWPKDVGVGGEVYLVFLVSGVSCSDLEARLTEAYWPWALHCGAMKKKGWFGMWTNSSYYKGTSLWKNSSYYKDDEVTDGLPFSVTNGSSIIERSVVVSVLLAHDYMQCFLEQMSLVNDPAVGEYQNLPGVEVRVPNFGSIRAFSHKNPLQPELCLGKFRAELEKLGYRDGDTLFGAPCDFRYAPPVPGQTSEVYSRYFKKFMGLVGTASKKRRKKAIIFGHSYGGMVALEFIRNAPLAWRDKYIKHLILIAPTLSNGFMEPVKNIATGSNILFIPATTLLSTRPMWRSFESAIMNFPSAAVFGHRPLVITKQRNYSAYDMEHFFTADGFSEGIEPFRKRAIPKMKNFKAPMVPMTCFNGVGNETPLRLIFWDNDFGTSPEAVYGDGDGKINLISILAFDREMRRQPGQKKQFKSIKIEKTHHSTITTDDFALRRIIQEIIEVNRQIYS